MQSKIFGFLVDGKLGVRKKGVQKLHGENNWKLHRKGTKLVFIYIYFAQFGGFFQGTKLVFIYIYFAQFGEQFFLAVDIHFSNFPHRISLEFGLVDVAFINMEHLSTRFLMCLTSLAFLLSLTKVAFFLYHSWLYCLFRSLDSLGSHKCLFLGSSNPHWTNAFLILILVSLSVSTWNCRNLCRIVGGISRSGICLYGEY